MLNKFRFKKHIPHLFIFIFGIAFASLLPVLNAYAHGGNISLIHGCVKNSNGSLRIIGANDSCNGNESPLDWSIQGVPGPSASPTVSRGGVFSVRGAANINILCSGPNVGTGAVLCDNLDAQVPVPADGILTSFTVWPNENSNTTGGPSTITILVNGAPSTLQVQIPAGSTSTVVDTDQVAVQGSDLITVQSHDPIGNGSTRFTASFLYLTN